MASDGEVLALLGDANALIGLLDMSFQVFAADWPETLEEFDELFPPPSLSTRFKKLSRYFQNLF